MSVLRLFFVVLALLASAFTALAEDRDLASRVGELDAHSRELLGVSLNAVRHLVGASPYGYRPLDYLESTGDIDSIKELESAGLAKVEIVNGLPDGTQKNSKFVRIVLQGQGEELRNCVLALQGTNAP